MREGGHRKGFRRLAGSRLGLLLLLVALAGVDYLAAKGLRALRDRGARQAGSAPAPGGAALSPESPVSLTIPGTASLHDSPALVEVRGGVSLFIAPSMMGRIVVGDSGETLPVDAFGVPDSAGPTLAVRTANRGALIAQFENDPPVPIGSRSCIFTPPRDGRLRFAINDADHSGNRGHFSVTVSIPEIRSVLAATPACGTVLR